MAEKFVITGGKAPKGEIEVKGAKNAALPILAATLLTSEPCFISNVPLIEDVLKLINIIEELGAEVTWIEKNKIKVVAKDIDPEKIPEEIIGKFRGSILLIGPLLARFGKLVMPPPGGCLIGARSIETHTDAFRQLGFDIQREGKLFNFIRRKGFSADDQEVCTVFKKENKDIYEVVFKEFSVTGTENILIYSALNPIKTVLKIADLDYQIQDLIEVLRKMGANITFNGAHCIEIEGKETLGGFDHTIIADPIEAGTFIALALATGGEVTIKNAELSYLDLFLKRLRDFGAKFEILSRDSIKVLPSRNLKIDKIQSLPYPGLHTDLQPELGVLATQCQGPTMIHDPLYEGRLKYLNELNKMGADIIYCDPHRAVVVGPTKLTGIRIPSPDLRAGAALIIAGLVAEGITTIENIYQIDRGYEKIEERLQKLGLEIKREND